MSNYQNFDLAHGSNASSNETTNLSLQDELVAMMQMMQKDMENDYKEMEAIWEEMEARWAIRSNRQLSMLSNTDASNKK
eukprot:2853965-Ditylum_brightwellii.AAC.1